MVRKYTYLEIYLNDLSQQISLSEFEKYFNKPHQTIKKHLKEFVDEKILIQDKRDKFLFYRCNLDNSLFWEYLEICEKERLIIFLKNPLFMRLYNKLSNFFIDSNILIFGSSVESDDYSDIDILIVASNKNFKEQLKEFEQIYSVKLHILHVKEENITETLKKELRIKHIIMNNHKYFIEVLYK